jgi:GPH family glycoside/pentoside/hexuronide:cation symporter
MSDEAKVQDKLTKLPLATKIFYGVGDIGNAVVNSSIQFFLMIFYTDAAMVAPAVAANALLLGKCWDAINDPIFGWVSDRVKSPLGRRRAFMIYGAVPLAITIMLLWYVPKGFSGAALFVWITVTFILFDTFWSFTNVPYYALTAELTDDYDERASLTAFRMVFSVPAFIIGAALTPAIVGLFSGKRLGYGIMGIAYGILAATALLICAARLRERPSAYDASSESTPFKALKETLKNRPFVQLIGAYAICNLAFALVKTMLAYLLTYQFHMADKVPLVMAVMLISVAACLFPWKLISERIDKGPAYAIGLAIGGIAVASTFLLPAKPSNLIYLIAIVAGIGFSANWVFPWAMIPDVVEYDRLISGQQRSGIFYGLWGLLYKISEGLGIVITGWVLQLYGYVPNAEQTPHALQGIRLFVGPFPLLLFLIGLPLLIWYPVTRKKHREVCEKIKARESLMAAVAH